MANIITAPRGTMDIYGELGDLYQDLSEYIENCFLNFGYHKMVTPVFENTSLFNRDNEESDMVKKEMYTFLDKSNRSLSLRPEGTASVIRSFIEHKMYATTNGATRLYYNFPVYRYERPQTGRYREFRQMGVEYLGLWTSYLTDLEMLHLIQIIFEPLGIPVTIKVNSLGSKADKIKYKQVLVDYLSQYKDQLCPDCLARLETNPLRILDCKIDSHKDFFKNIPSILDYISPIELQRLKDLERAYNDIEFDANIQIDPRLVRGLDYYSHMVFEVYAKDEKFASYGAIGAGGNYDSLVSELGGPNYVGVGFALGFDRLVEIFAKNENKSFKLSRNPNIQFILLDERAREFVTKMALITAGGGIRVHFAQQINSLKSQLADASKRKAQFAVIVGGDEYDNATITIKDLETAKQISIPNTEFKDWLEMTFFQITTPFLNED